MVLFDHNHEMSSSQTQEANSESNEKMTILVASDDFDRVFLAFMIAMSARSMGLDVNMFFALWGINLLRRDSDQPAMEAPETSEEKQKKGIMAKMMAMMMPKGPDQLKLSKMNMGGMGVAMMKKFIEQSGATSLTGLMDMSVDAGVEFTVCSLTMEIMGFTHEDLLGLPNLSCAGVTSCLGNAIQSKMFFVI